MRYSAVLAGGLACLNLSAAQAQPVTHARSAFCGSIPSGWTPPWEKPRRAPSAPDLACHLIGCDQRGRQRAGQAQA
ncbi:MAG: hypothetical protein ABW039_11400 [Sphingobium sp.]